MALYVTRLAIKWPEFMRLSNRKQPTERFVAATFSGFVKVCDLYLWGYLKGKVCESNPHTFR